MTARRTALRAALATALSAMAPAAPAGSALPAARSVLIVVPDDADRLGDVAEAFAKAMSGAQRRASGDLGASPGATAEGWPLVAGIGSAGERAVRQAMPAARLMVCGAPASDAPGVVLEHDHAMQLAMLRRALPEARRVGVVFHATAGRRRYEQVAQAAKRAGLEAVPLGVTSGVEVPFVVEAAAERLDALMTLPDAEILTPAVARTLLLLSMRRRVPLVGPAGSWAKAGALYALDWDYEDLGRQCADAARRLLAQPAASAAAAEPPRRVRLVVNRRAAQHLKVRLPVEFLGSAVEVYE